MWLSTINELKHGDLERWAHDCVTVNTYEGNSKTNNVNLKKKKNHDPRLTLYFNWEI